MATLSSDELKNEEQRGARDLRADLGMLCCLAAAEADRLLRGEKDPPIEYAGLLRVRLESYIPSFERGEARSLAESNTMRAMAMSLRNIAATRRSGEVTLDPRGISEQLDQIQKHPDTFGTPAGNEILRTVKDFCLGLSRSLRSVGFPPDMNAYLRWERSKAEAGREAP